MASSLLGASAAHSRPLSHPAGARSLALAGVTSCGTLPGEQLPGHAASYSPAPTVTSQTVVFGADQGRPLLGEIVAPVNVAAPLPAVVVVHGGAWVHGDPALMRPAARALASSGFLAFDISYRLATAGDPGFPGEVGDLRQAVAYLRGHAAKLGIDPRRIGVLGSSAGGNLALLLATAGHGSCSAGTRVAAVVTWSAPMDLAGYGRANERYCRTRLTVCPMLFRSAERYVGCPYSTCPARWHAASVTPYVRSDDPPALLFNSSNEIVPLAQAQRLVRLFDWYHVPARLVVFSGRLHAIAYAAEALPGTVKFFYRYLG
ncbi:MAG: alpha/beta hydrolase fold domain-containing protein [Acidimicrobiales bacterium]